MDRILKKAILLPAATVVLAASALGGARGATNASGHMGHDSMPGMSGGTGQAMSHGMPKSMRSLERATGRNFDIAFMSEMIEHHRGAIQMGQMEMKGGHHDEVKDAARKTAEAQRKDINRMTSWLRTWYRRGPDTRLQGVVRAESAPMMAQFRSDCRRSCDAAFLTHMSMHHRDGIRMAQLAVRKANRPALRNMARKMIAEQSREIREFQTMQKNLHPEGDDH